MTPSRVHGPYALYDALQALGSGAAASVHLGVARGRETTPVAIKRLHAGQARQPAAVARLLDEVRLTRNIVHPNVVRTLDFVSDGEEMLAVMEYVHGEPLSRLLGDCDEAGAKIPVNIALRIAVDVLHGLEAAHGARDQEGKPLLLVHRDVTPENILVGADGVARLMDFGVAKAEGRLHATHDGGVRGKLAYLAPEQIGGEVTPRTDLYAVGLVTWEMIVGERAIQGDNEGEMLVKALDPNIAKPGTRRPDVSPVVDDVIMRSLAKTVEGRFEDASAQADAYEHAAAERGGIATAKEVAAFVQTFGGVRLAARAESVHAMIAADNFLLQGPSQPASGRHSAPSQNIAVPPLYSGLGDDDDPTAVAGTQHLLSGETPAEEGERGHFIGLAVMVAVALTVLGIALLLRKHEPEAAGGPSMEEAASSLPAAMTASAAPPPPAAVVPTPSASVRTVSPASLPAAPTEQPHRNPTPPPPRRAAKNCDPPWTLDANGIRRYDPACVK